MFLVLLGCFVCQMGLGAGYIFGATLKHIVAEFDWSRTAFSAASAPLLASMALFPGGVLGPVFAGAMFDRLGDYRIAFGLLAVLNVVGFLALTRIRCEQREALAWT